jgi:cyanophycin synthetase
MRSINRIKDLPWDRLYHFYYNRLELRTLSIRIDFWRLRKKYYKNFWAYVAKNMGASIEEKGKFYLISKNDYKTIVSQTRVRINDSLIEDFLLDKEATQSLLGDCGVPIPENVVVHSKDVHAAKEYFKARRGDLVVKPSKNTAGGKGVTTNINDEAVFLAAFKRAARLDSKVLIEEHISGKNYRLTYLNGKLIDAIHRGPPTVTGDGRSTLKALIREENSRRLKSSEVTSLMPLIADDDCRNCLRKQGLTLNSRPQKGEVVQVKEAINETSSRETLNVTDQVHPEIVELGERAVRAIGVTWGGVDVQCEDISKSPSESPCWILEVNAPAGIHHHYLIANTAKLNPVGEILLNYIFENKSGTMGEKIEKGAEPKVEESRPIHVA